MYQPGDKVILLYAFGELLPKGSKGVIIRKEPDLFGHESYAVWFPSLDDQYVFLGCDLARAHKLSTLLYF